MLFCVGQDCNQNIQGNGGIQEEAICGLTLLGFS
jgi:hypothetical protein